MARSARPTRSEQRVDVGAIDAVERGEEAQVLLAGHGVVEVLLLEADADLGLGHGVVATDVSAQDADLAAVGLQLPGEHLDGGGLAGAVGAQEAEDLAGRDLEADALDGLRVAVAEAQVLRADGSAVGSGLDGVGLGHASSLGTSGLDHASVAHRAGT